MSFETTPVYYTPPPSPPARSGHRALALAIVLSVLLGLAGGALATWVLAGMVRQAALGIRLPSAAGLSSIPGIISGPADGQGVAAAVDPAIVDINTVIDSAGASGQGAATGLVLTSNGEILTNNHVVDGSTSIRVTIAGRSGSYTANVVGVDPSADVALIKVNGVSGLPTIKIAPGTAQVGESVVALGNAGGQGGAPTVTEGQITAVDRSITASDNSGASEQLTGMLETDATIVAGDSGGALVDSAGRLVGMITAGGSQGFRFQRTNVGFAVPVNTALDIVKRIRAGQAGSDIILGKPGYIGVVVGSLDQATADRLGVSSGVAVDDVQSGGPAERAGIASGAVIVRVGQTPVSSLAGLSAAIHAHHPGDRLAVTWVDDSGTHSATLTLVSGPAV